MENAAEALKMAFAVLIFVIAMSLVFALISQARSTADVVFRTTDKQEYVEGITSIGQDSTENYRIVGIDTIVPAIYRTRQENYGVTILDSHNDIIALYDLTVEGLINNYSAIKTSERFRQLCVGDPEATAGSLTPDTTVGITTYIQKSADASFDWDVARFQTFFEDSCEIRPAGGGGRFTASPWMSDPYNQMRRIKGDMSGKNVVYDVGTYKNQLLPSDGFIKGYRDTKFKEYYYTVKTKNNLTQEEETSKLQIIYIEEP